LEHCLALLHVLQVVRHNSPKVSTHHDSTAIRTESDMRKELALGENDLLIEAGVG